MADDANISGSPQKDPDDWVTGEEPMTGPQASYLETLCRETRRSSPRSPRPRPPS